MEHMYKDVNICMDMAKECRMTMSGESTVLAVYNKAMELGYGKEDFCATIKAVRQM